MKTSTRLSSEKHSEVLNQLSMRCATSKMHAPRGNNGLQDFKGLQNTSTTETSNFRKTSRHFTRLEGTSGDFVRLEGTSGDFTRLQGTSRDFKELQETSQDFMTEAFVVSP
jgi:hypothetical protein